MTRVLHLLLRRTPVGWLQLIHNRMRLIAAVAGIAFANLLVFVQLGVVASLTSVTQLVFTPFHTDIIISPLRPQFLNGEMISRRLMYNTLADPAVAEATPLYVETTEWKRSDGSSTTLIVYGMLPEAAAFAGETIGDQLAMLAPADRVLLDTAIPDIDQDLGAAAVAQLSPELPLRFEIDGHAVSAVGGFRLGSGFDTAGAMVVSDQTFQQLFPERTAGTPSHILIRVKPNKDPATVAGRLRERLALERVQVRTTAQAIADDVTYMNDEASIGIIFGMGVFIGILVGLVIVYQVLSTDVAAHMKEYATFKAMGYPHRFLLGIVFEEALIIAILGFVPGVLLGGAIYEVMSVATGLPIGMKADRALAVFVGTFVACALSGALATLRLRRAEPAELF
ncbi:FtsX-like permease family protein [Pseudorhizobium marinum]|uniref:FtsX-like permease family protein n=1 Tax=Pseudorhizobium marinum TaxID=1496690 RepID=UPI0004967A94|nr:FtsX-like permease family protein [Pseudorhizobium marinum]